MTVLKKIGYLCDKYDVSPRTIRFYEEKLLISSIRDIYSGYRYFNEENEKRLQLILLLRKLDLSIKDVQEIFSQNSIQLCLMILNKKISEIDRNIEALEVVKEKVITLLNISKDKKFKKLDEIHSTNIIAPTDSKQNMNKEDNELMAENVLNKLTDNDVKIIRLNPVRVAFVNSGLTQNPEGKAVTHLMNWVREHKLFKNPNLRYFGYDSPAPKTMDFENEVYGYEMCVTLPDDFVDDGGISTKMFEGGLYATVSYSFNSGTDQIPTRWKQLVEWVKESEYSFARQQYFEEYYCHFDDFGNDEYENLEFYLPIVKK